MPLSLNSEQHQCIEDIIKTIAEGLIEQENDSQPFGLYNGLCGHLLFLYQLSMFRPDWVDEDKFNHKLEIVQELVPHLSEQIDLCNGLTGVAWLLEYFNQCQGEDYEAAMCESIDEMLTDFMDAKPWGGEIEFIYGLAGVGCYAARRGRQHQGIELYQRIVSFYEQQAIACDVGISWTQPQHSIFRYDKEAEREFNLGLAHGVPGIIAILLPAIELPILSERATALVTKSCDWLMAQSDKTVRNISFYGSFSGDKRNSRLGWCYGDLTIALTIARVGKVLGRQDYIEFATLVALDCAKRDSKQAMINDAGLCHGSAGLALIFKLIYQHIELPELLSACEFWVEHCLNLYRKDGLHGLYMFDGHSQSYAKSSGLLMGDAGVALCLLGVIDDGQVAANSWLDCMALS